MEKNSKIYVAGHCGLVGSALVRKLRENGYDNLVLKKSKELDLRRQADVENFFFKERPEYVFLAAARVGGIHANDTYRAEFIYDNLMIASNVINSSYVYGVSKLLSLGSSCIYPKFAPQPLKEEYLLTGSLEKTNEPYALAKIAGIKLCESYNKQYGTNYISAMPTNLYGIHDNFHVENGHVIPSLLRKFHDAKIGEEPEVLLWGSGTPLREFLYVDDLAEALIFMMENYNDSQFLNIGSGKEITIRDLAMLIQEIVDYKGKVSFDASKPDGTPRKLLDISRIRKLGWEPKSELREGIEKTYRWFVDNYKFMRLK